MDADGLRTPAILAAVRVVFAVVVIVYGGWAWWVHHRATWVPPTRAEFERLRTVGLAVWTIGVGGIVALASLAPRLRDPRRRAVAQLAAWTAGESVACFGAVYYLRTGHAQWFAFGVVAMVGGFMLLPVRR